MPQVNWQLLPNQPQKFFGLNADFSRRDLKRAYGKLIRTYKPETHPEEFQKIRRAFEALENQVRYGIQQQTMAAQTDAWNAAVTSKTKEAGKKSTDGASRSRPLTEGAIRDPGATYKKLRALKDKTPQDFFVLAVLSDLVTPKQPDAFFLWLMKGLQRHPRDPGLQQLVREYLLMDLKPKQAASVLQSCSKVLPGDVFYRLTESLWSMVFREQEFAVAARLLKACEQNIQHKDARARVTFYLHVLRLGIWKADQRWTSHVLKFIESNGSLLDPSAEQELEFLTMMQGYLDSDQSRLPASELKESLESMLRSYCEDPWDLAVAKVAQVQDRLARNSRGVIEAFPVTEDNESHIRLITMCMIVVSDVAEQTGVEYGTATDRQSERQAFAALSDLRDSIVPVLRKLNWQQYRTYGVPFVLLIIAPPIAAFMGTSFGGWMLLVSLAWLAISTIVYFLWLKPSVLDPRVQDRGDALVTNAYQHQWRARLFRYVQSCGEAPQVAIRNLQHAAADSGDAQWLNVVLSFISGDGGLILFGQAQMFLT